MTDDRSAETAHIASYLAGGGTSEERVLFRAWIADSPERTRELERLERIWHGASGALASVDTDAMWNALAREIGKKENSFERSFDNIEMPVQAVVRQPGGEVAAAARQRLMLGRTFAGPSRTRRVMSAVGALAICAVAGITGWQAKGHLFGAGARAVTTYVTGNGQRANINLPDGTTVTLNVGSRLDVTEFTSGHRDVAVHGEAYFNVAHHDGAPFVVNAGNTKVRVLGTSFVVRNYDTDHTTMVAVKDGRVAVKSVVLGAAQRLSIAPNGVAERRVADPSLFTFASGTLTLEPMSLSQAIVELNRWYDADIQLGDPSLASLGLGGKFTAGSLSDLAPLLEGTLPVRTVREGKRLTLYPR